MKENVYGLEASQVFCPLPLFCWDMTSSADERREGLRGRERERERENERLTLALSRDRVKCLDELWLYKLLLITQ